jgi:hypothetical protein
MTPPTPVARWLLSGPCWPASCGYSSGLGDITTDVPPAGSGPTSLPGDAADQVVVLLRPPDQEGAAVDVDVHRRARATRGERRIDGRPRDQTPDVPVPGRHHDRLRPAHLALGQHDRRRLGQPSGDRGEEPGQQCIAGPCQEGVHDGVPLGCGVGDVRGPRCSGPGGAAGPPEDDLPDHRIASGTAAEGVRAVAAMVSPVATAGATTTPAEHGTAPGRAVRCSRGRRPRGRGRSCHTRHGRPTP